MLLTNTRRFKATPYRQHPTTHLLPDHKGRPPHTLVLPLKFSCEVLLGQYILQLELIHHLRKRVSVETAVNFQQFSAYTVFIRLSAQPRISVHPE